MRASQRRGAWRKAASARRLGRGNLRVSCGQVDQAQPLMRLRDRDRRAGHRTLPKATSLGQDGGLQREQPLSDWRPAVPLRSLEAHCHGATGSPPTTATATATATAAATATATATATIAAAVTATRRAFSAVATEAEARAGISPPGAMEPPLGAISGRAARCRAARRKHGSSAAVEDHQTVAAPDSYKLTPCNQHHLPLRERATTQANRCSLGKSPAFGNL